MYGLNVLICVYRLCPILCLNKLGRFKILCSIMFHGGVKITRISWFICLDSSFSEMYSSIELFMVFKSSRIGRYQLESIRLITEYPVIWASVIRLSCPTPMFKTIDLSEHKRDDMSKSTLIAHAWGPYNREQLMVWPSVEPLTRAP